MHLERTAGFDMEAWNKGTSLLYVDPPHSRGVKTVVTCGGGCEKMCGMVAINFGGACCRDGVEVKE